MLRARCPAPCTLITARAALQHPRPLRTSHTAVHVVGRHLLRSCTTSSALLSTSRTVLLLSRAAGLITSSSPRTAGGVFVRGDNTRGSSSSVVSVRAMSSADGAPQREPESAAGKFGAVLRADTPGKAEPLKGVPPGLLDNVWRQREQVACFPALTKDEGEVDVVVVGAGIVGLNIAYQLATHGKSVAVVEARTRGAGQSGRTSAHIMQWNDDFYSELESKYGLENNKLIARSMTDAIDFIENVVKAEKLDCEFTRLDGYLFPAKYDQSSLKQLDEELEACHRAGMNDVVKVDLKGDSRLGSVTAALLFPRSAEFHPVKYINELADALSQHHGVKLFEMSRVQRKDMGHDGTVPALSGGRVRARQAVVLATNSPITLNVSVHARQQPWRTYMLGLSLPKGSTARANWWTTEEIYHYIRIQPEEHRDVLLIGGQDHVTGQDPGSYQDVWAELEAFARARWPQAREVVYRWSGQVYEPADQLGLYGLDPLNPLNSGAAGGPELPGAVPRYIATGDSGQGMTGSAIAAMVIGGELTGHPSPYADLYSTARLRTLAAPSSLEEVATEVVETSRGFMRVLPRSVEDIKGVLLPDTIGEGLQPGEGRVVNSGASKVALYRDEAGTLHKRSAICTHLGCAVEWNPMDSTFDCCCHGSQFDHYGRVINGPACVDLEDLGTVKA